MAVPGIEHRVAALESEVARLKEQLAKAVPAQEDWLDAFSGVFDNDPVYEEAMRLGREYRESLRPTPRSKQPKQAQSTKATKG
jgi:hypothetical protein